MIRVLFRTFVAVVAVSVLWTLMRPVFSDDPVPAAFTKATAEMRQVAIAAKFYADGHRGRLPQCLEELVPAYLPDPAAIGDAHFLAPGAVLAGLPPESIILSRVVTDDQRHWTRVVVVHPDLSVQMRLP